MGQLDKILTDIKACTICSEHLPLGPNPVVSVSKSSRILIVGQAPGTKVHKSGIPWDDQSGKKLREWMGISDAIFYNNSIIGIMPMGFCYPGKGKSGDLPPRKECAEYYHENLLKELSNIELTVLIGQYAQNEYLKDRKKDTLTNTVKAYKEYLPNLFCLPHPSPRNNIWLKKNDWFEKEVVPILKNTVQDILGTN